EHVILSGAVLVTVRGRGTGNARLSAMGLRPPATAISPELLAALHEPTKSPWAEVAAMLRADGALTPVMLVGAMLVAGAAVGVQAIVMRGLLDLGRALGLGAQRLGAIGCVVLLAAAIAMVNLPISAGLLGMGRKLETRLRAAFLRKIPRIGDRYFHS